RLPEGLDVLLHVPEHGLVERRLSLIHTQGKIEDPNPSRTARHVETVGPRDQHIRAGFAVRVRGSQHAQSYRLRDVEWPALRVAHEGDPEVLRETAGGR